MGLVSPAQVTDGSTADASDVNSPINTIANEFNGNIDDANIKSAAAINATKLASGTITNTQMSTEVKPVTRFTDDFFDHVASGCVWSGDSYGSTRVASMTAGVVYVSGIRATVSAVTSRTFTASKDTYIDVDSTGAITYTEVANNAASPALSAGNVRIGIIVTAAGSIAAVGSVNQGEEYKILPIASSVAYSVTDSLGNLICPRDPNRKILGHKQILNSFTSGAGTDVQITGLSVPFIAPGNRKVRVISYMPQLSTTSGAGTGQFFALKEGATQLTTAAYVSVLGNYAVQMTVMYIGTPSAGLHTYNQMCSPGGAGTLTINATAAQAVFTSIELI